jgi:predicted ATPase/class 3 adenylate cyclase
MNFAHLYMPQDRQRSLLHPLSFAEDREHSILFCDIAGFTPLTEILVRLLGSAQGAELLTIYLNSIYDKLISKVDDYGGSVIGFAGDAMTCLFSGLSAFEAIACALDMQTIIRKSGQFILPDTSRISLAMKVVVVTGSVRRFLVGDPAIQVMDVLAGKTMDRLAAIEQMARAGDVLVDERTVQHLGTMATITAWYEAEEFTPRYALVTAVEPDRTIRPSSGRNMKLPDTIIDTYAARPWLLPPVYERLKNGQEQFLADIRPTVVVFVSFRGIDYDHDTNAGNKLQTYIQWAQQVLARYEGFLLQIITGDKGSYFYAAFGSPLAHDDDPVRAVAAALELHNLPSACSFIHHMQIGISEGWAYAGAYGGRTRSTYGVLGDEVNLAARLMQAARPGQILVSQRIARAIAHQYTLQPAGSIQVKGKRDIVPVALVLPGQHALLTPTGLLVHYVLIGRERETTWLDTVFEQVQAGQGRILCLEGDAGVGKSHLISAWSARIRQRGVRIIAGVCQSVNQQVSYTPWQPIVSTLLEISHTVLAMMPRDEQIAHIEAVIERYNPTWLLRLPLLGDVLGIPIPENPTTAAFDARLRQDSLFALVIDMLRLFAREQPLLLRLEDVHWIDEASAALLQAVCRVIAHQPILVCITQRPIPPERRSMVPELTTHAYYERMNLAELDVAGVTALIEDTLQGPASPLLLSLVYTRAQGNPFFIEELLDALNEAEMLSQQEDTTWTLSPDTIQRLQKAHCLERDRSGNWIVTTNAPLTAVLNLPDSVYTTVLARLDRLPEAQKLTLKAASVLGQFFESDILLPIHPLKMSVDVLSEHLQALEQRDFIRLESPSPNTVYAFRHNITQEVTYTTMLQEQRRFLHQAAGEVMEALQPAAVERLAYHYSRSGVRDKMLLYLDLAARKSRYEYANETALIYYTQALQQEERWEWYYGQAATYHILGQREEEETALHQLEAAPGAPAFAVSFLWGQYYEATSDYEQAQSAFERARDDYRQRGNRAGEARCLAQLGVVARRRGDYASAADWLERALGLLEGDPTQTVEGAQVLVTTLNEIGTIYFYQGRYDEATACFLKALEMSRSNSNSEGEAQALSHLGTVADMQRDFTDALDFYNRSLELRRAIGDRAGEGDSLYNIAIIVRQSGDYHRAQQNLSTALDIYKAVSNRWGGVNSWNELGILYQELGDLSRAEGCLRHGLELSHQIGDEAGKAYILLNLGLVAIEQEDLHAAEKILTDGIALAQAQDDKYLLALFLNYLATVSFLSNQMTQAITYASNALALRRELELQYNEPDDMVVIASAYRALGDMPQALSYAQQALTILDKCEGEGPEFPQRDYFLCYQVLAAVEDTATAHHALTAAYQLVMKRSDKITDPDLRRSFLEQVSINREIREEMQKNTALPPDKEQGRAEA